MKEFSLADRPSIDKALRIIGGHQDSKKILTPRLRTSRDVSSLPFPNRRHSRKEPKAAGRKIVRRKHAASIQKRCSNTRMMFRFWLKSGKRKGVTRAQKRFETWALNRGQEYSLAFFANGNYRWEEKLNAKSCYMLARVFWVRLRRIGDFLAGNPEVNIKNQAVLVMWPPRRIRTAKMPSAENLQQISQEAIRRHA